jgi:acyl-coenzyme A thioesterase PaaI-like protein
MSDLEKLRTLVAGVPKPPCEDLIPFSIKTSFLAPAKLGTCISEGTIRAGRSIVFAEGRLWGSDGKLAVHATATLATK